MNIQVWKRYAENRASEPIEEGVYSQSDPHLQGLARYLIDNGNAVEVVEAPPQVVEVVEAPAIKFVDYTDEQIENLENQARELTAENDVTRATNAEAKKPKRTRKAKS